ncbi:MAG: ester cyclase [Burkholderiales bacterium]|nr:ester cyclase [Burkholderiales bacterium]
MQRRFRIASTAAVLSLLSAGADARTGETSLPVPQHLFGAQSLDSGDSATTILAARRYAAFWNSGDADMARLALAPDFTDHTLPAGRPQGVQGLLQASATFLAAVPDLKVEISDMLVAGDRVTLRLHFTGHFSGKFGEHSGKGQAIDFQAFDFYKIRDGRISDNWHLEDNLHLLQQMGVMTGAKP